MGLCRVWCSVERPPGQKPLSTVDERVVLILLESYLLIQSVLLDCQSVSMLSSTEKLEICKTANTSK